MYCKDCGKQIPNNSKFCKYCGSNQNISVDTKSNDFVTNIPQEKNYFESAKKAKKHTLLIGVFELLSLILVFATGLISSFIANNQNALLAVIICGIVISFGFSVPSLVFLIITFTKYKAIKLHTNVNPLFVILNLAIPLGLGSVLSTINFTIQLILNVNVLALLIMFLICFTYLIIISFVISYKIGKTLHE